jgi:Leucine-rich repeat (LRR) protein
VLQLWGRNGSDSKPLRARSDPDEVLARLREANPQWKGAFEPERDGERVVGLKLSGGALTDLEPLAALADLEELRYEGPSYAKGRLNDLSPLAKLTGLKQVTIRHCAVTDLSPLGRLKLEKLDLVATRVSNLKPLRGLPLKQLHLHGTQVADLSPLVKCPFVEDLYCPGTVETLEPLRQLTGLKKVQLYGCDKVTSLSPLSGSPVEYLDCRGVGVNDLDELANWPHLRVLYCDKRFTGKIPPLPKLARLELDPLFTGKKP